MTAKKIAISTLALFFAAVALAQSNRPPAAPTPSPQSTEAQCVADAEAWHADFANDDKRLVTEIQPRFTEMTFCLNHYPKHRELFRTEWGVEASELLERTANFIHRHNLNDKFIEEDAEEVRKNRPGLGPALDKKPEPRQRPRRQAAIGSPRR